MKDVVATIDIGTSKICVFIGRLNRFGEVEIIGRGVKSHDAIRKGVIINIEEIAYTVIRTVAIAEREADVKIGSAYINISAVHGDVIYNRAEININSKNSVISASDVYDVLEEASKVVLPDGMRVIDVVPRQYYVDSFDGIENPKGMAGSKLAVEADVIVGSNTYIQSVLNVFESAGLKIDGIIFEPLALSNVVLKSDEHHDGVIMLDVGGGLTSISVYGNDMLLYTGNIPVGGQHITSDLSVCLKITPSEAERIKRKYELALTKLIEYDQDIQIINRESGDRENVKVSQAVEIIEARVKEIFELCRREIDQSAVRGVAKNVVLVGSGIAYMDGGEEMAKAVFGLDVRHGNWNSIGQFDSEDGMAASIINYVFSRIDNDENSSEIYTHEELIKSQKFGWERVKLFLDQAYNKCQKIWRRIF